MRQSVKCQCCGNRLGVGNGAVCVYPECRCPDCLLVKKIKRRNKAAREMAERFAGVKEARAG